MNELIRFSSAQIARLKTRLEIYKTAGKGRGRSYSWIELIDQIEQCEAAFAWLREVQTESPSDHDALWEETVQRERSDKGRPMTTNVLQKWLRGELVTRGRGNNKVKFRHFTTPSAHNLMAVYAFLKEKNFILDADLKTQDWSYATLACQFRDQFWGEAAASIAPITPTLPAGEYYGFTYNNKQLVVRRLTLIDYNLDDVYEIHERQMLFTVWRKRERSQTSHINIDKPTTVTHLVGWCVQKGSAMMAFLKSNSGTPENIAIFHAMAPEQGANNDRIMFSIIETKEQKTAKPLEVSFLMNSDKFVDNVSEFIDTHKVTTYGSKLKLLRPSTLNMTTRTSYFELIDCIKYIDKIDIPRFQALVEGSADINARNPATGQTILHHIAQTLNRPALKVLIKRADLDYLVQDNAGYYPSLHALDVDTSSPIGHFLLKKELASAQQCGINYQAQIATISLTPD